jgi:predicted nucleic-acid-binding protein
MIGLDTNILVRYFTQDDPIQSATATAWIEERLTSENPGFISVVAMAETVWVLERTYRMADFDIASAVEKLLQADNLVIEREQQVFAAAIALKKNQGAFADLLIGELGARAGCSGTITFDRRALRVPGFSPA